MDDISKEFRDLDTTQLAQLAQSAAARQLFAMLGGSDNPQLQSAVNSAAAGDLSQAQLILQQLMKDPQASALLRQLMGGIHG